MLLNNSPLKNTSDKLKSPQASIKTIKFERKKDYKSFLKFIERESKALKEIKLPSLDEEKNKKSSLIGSILGLGGLGLLALFGGGGDDGDPNDQPNKFDRFDPEAFKRSLAIQTRISNLSTGSMKASQFFDDANTTKKKSGEFDDDKDKNIKFGKKKLLFTEERVTREELKLREKNKLKKLKRKRGETTTGSTENRNKVTKKGTTTVEVGGDTTRKTSTVTVDDIRGKRGTEQRRVSKQFFNESSDTTQKSEIPRSIQRELDRINRDLNRQNLPSTKRDRLLKRLSQIEIEIKTLKNNNQLTEGQFNRAMNEADNIRKRADAFVENFNNKNNKKIKISRLDRFTNFSDRILNSRAVKVFDNIVSGEFIAKLIIKSPKKSFPIIGQILDVAFPDPLNPNEEEELIKAKKLMREMEYEKFIKQMKDIQSGKIDVPNFSGLDFDNLKLPSVNFQPPVDGNSNFVIPFALPQDNDNADLNSLILQELERY